MKGTAKMDPAPWIALNSITGLGPALYKRLILRFGSAEAVFGAPAVELARVTGIKPDTAKAIKEFSGWRQAEEEVLRTKNLGAEIITFSDDAYPPNLKETHDPPPYLYVRGRLVPEDRVSLAVVGSRGATEPGRKMTVKIAGELAAKGITVVSGGAKGIDTEAHKGALAARGRTIAVLGCGLDVTYPPENKELFGRIAESGAVITEYPVGTEPFRGNFPARNRIISGISLGVLVVEATDDSGSLITANFALDQGREVYAVPGSVASPTARGTNGLIKKGAKLVQGTEDILLDLFPYLKGYLRELNLEAAAEANPEPAPEIELDPEERALFDCISVEPAHIDNLAARSGMEVRRALSVLLNMELKGAVKQVSGMRFIREN
jgi:DNA processing protein